MSASLTSGRLVNEAYGLDDEPFGFLLVAGDPSVGDVDRAAALSDAVNVITDSETPDMAWAAMQAVSMRRCGLAPADPRTDEILDTWLVHGELPAPATFSARPFSDVTDEGRRGVLAAVIAFGVDPHDAPGLAEWVSDHALGTGTEDIAATWLWLEHEDDDLLERRDELFDRMGELAGDWEVFADDCSLGDIPLWLAAPLGDEFRANGDVESMRELVTALSAHPRGRIALLDVLVNEPTEEERQLLRQFAWQGVPEARLALVFQESVRHDCTRPQAIVHIAAEVDEPRFHRDLIADVVHDVVLIEHATAAPGMFGLEPSGYNKDCDVSADLAEQGWSELFDVAEDAAVDVGLRAILLGEIARALGAEVAVDVPVGIANLLDKFGLSDMLGAAGGSPVARRRRRVLELAEAGITPDLGGDEPPAWLTPPDQSALGVSTPEPPSPRPSGGGQEHESN